MKAIDILSLAQGICTTLDKNEIKVTDVRYVEMYQEWQRMKQEGHNWDWIMYWLGKQYDLSEASVWRILKRLDREIEM